MYQASAPVHHVTQQTSPTEWDSHQGLEMKEALFCSSHPHSSLPTEQGLPCGSRRQMTLWPPAPEISPKILWSCPKYFMLSRYISRDFTRNLIMHILNIKIYLWPQCLVNLLICTLVIMSGHSFFLSHEFNLELIFSFIRTFILINIVATDVVTTHLVSSYSPKIMRLWRFSTFSLPAWIHSKCLSLENLTSEPLSLQETAHISV